jgi:plasmid stabilization system protein ParE
MDVRVEEAARRELGEAASYYGSQRPGMRQEFLAEVDRAFEQLRRHPHAGTPIAGGLRRRVLRRSSYSVFYGVEDSVVTL